MADLARARDDLAAFAAMAAHPLEPWQSAALRLDTRVTALVAPRQSGKSRSLALLGLWWAFRRAEQRVLLVSAGEEASRRLLSEVRRIAVGSPLLAVSVEDESAGLLTLSNGSELRSVPASDRQVRGWAVDLLLVDEAALVPDDLLLGAAFPTTAARADARIVLGSSATTASGAFFDHVRIGEAGSEHVRSYRWALTDCWWITPSAIEAARESMTEARFRAEYEGVFASGADALFTRQALERVTADYLPSRLAELEGPARVLAGVDWGATTDRSALVAVGRLAVPGEQLFAVACAERWPAGYPLHRVVEEIAGAPAAFDTLAIETNGLGLPLAQDLVRALRDRPESHGGARPPGGSAVVDAAELDDYLAARSRDRTAERQAGAFATRKLLVHTTAEMKAAAYSALRLLVDRERLLLPASAEDLRRELLMLRVDLSPTGTERIEASTGHDDLADALMLAAIPYRSRRDKRWRSWLAELADPRQRLPAAGVPGADVERVETPGGRAVPRVPVWASVRGRELTVPAGLEVGDPKLRALRERVRAAMEEPDQEEVAP